MQHTRVRPLFELIARSAGTARWHSSTAKFVFTRARSWAPSCRAATATTCGHTRTPWAAARSSCAAPRRPLSSFAAASAGDDDEDEEEEVEIAVDDDIDVDEDDEDDEDEDVVYPPSPRDRAHEILQVDEHGDSIYVRQRRVYNRQVSALRKQYAAEYAAAKRNTDERKAARRRHLETTAQQKGAKARRRLRAGGLEGTGERDDAHLVQEEKAAQLRLVKNTWRDGDRAARARRKELRDERRAAALMAQDALPLAAEADSWIGVLEHELFKVYRRRMERESAKGTQEGNEAAMRARRAHEKMFAQRAAQLIEESSWKAMGVPAHLRRDAMRFVAAERDADRAAGRIPRGTVVPMPKVDVERMLQQAIQDGEGPEGYGKRAWNPNRQGPDEMEEDEYANKHVPFAPDARLVLSDEDKARVRDTLGWLPADPSEALAAARAAGLGDEAAAAEDDARAAGAVADANVAAGREWGPGGPPADTDALAEELGLFDDDEDDDEEELELAHISADEVKDMAVDEVLELIEEVEKSGLGLDEVLTDSAVNMAKDLLDAAVAQEEQAAQE